MLTALAHSAFSSMGLFLYIVVACQAQQRYVDDLAGGNRKMRCNSPFGTDDITVSWLVTDLDGSRPVWPAIPKPKYVVTTSTDLELCGALPCLKCSPTACWVEVTVMNLEVKDSAIHNCSVQSFRTQERRFIEFAIGVLSLPNAIYVTKKLENESIGQRYDFEEHLETAVPVSAGQKLTLDFTVTESYPAAEVTCDLPVYHEETVTITNGTTEPYTKTVTYSMTFTAVENLDLISCTVDLKHEQYSSTTYKVYIEVQSNQVVCGSDGADVTLRLPREMVNQNHGIVVYVADATLAVYYECMHEFTSEEVLHSGGVLNVHVDYKKCGGVLLDVGHLIMNSSIVAALEYGHDNQMFSIYQIYCQLNSVTEEIKTQDFNIPSLPNVKQVISETVIDDVISNGDITFTMELMNDVILANSELTLTIKSDPAIRFTVQECAMISTLDDRITATIINKHGCLSSGVSTNTTDEAGAIDINFPLVMIPYVNHVYFSCHVTTCVMDCPQNECEDGLVTQANNDRGNGGTGTKDVTRKRIITSIFSL